MAKPRFVKIQDGTRKGYGWYGDPDPPPTLEEQIEELQAKLAEMEEVTRVPYEILERIGLRMGMAQHPMREIGGAVLELIHDGEWALMGKLYAALAEAGCQEDNSCSDESGWCCVCLATASYEPSR